MKKLLKADTFGSVKDWQTHSDNRKEVYNYLKANGDPCLCEEDIDDILVALVNLNYLSFGE